MAAKGNGGSIAVVNDTGASLVVTITRGGVTPTVYTTEALSVAHSMPLTITATTSFWLADAGQYTVSVTQNGREIASGGGTITVALTGGCGLGFTPAVDSYIPVESRLRVPGDPTEEQALSVALYDDLVVADETTEAIVFTHEDYSGDPLAAGAFDPGQGVTLNADHENITFAEAGWWYVWYSVRMTAVADAAAVIFPIGSSNGVTKIPVFLKAGKTTQYANQGPIFQAAGLGGGGALAVGSIDGELSVTEATLYMWRIDAPYEGEVPA